MVSKKWHNKGMKVHSSLYDTIATISYTIGTTVKSYNVPCTINGLSDQEKATGAYSLSTLYFTFRYDDIKLATEKKTKLADCIVRGFKGKDIIYLGTKYSIDAESPNGSTQDCVVLRGLVNG